MAMRNVQIQPRERWTPWPHHLDQDAVALGYGPLEMHRGIYGAMENKLPILDGTKPVWDLPPLGPSPVRSEAPIAVVRPVMRRLEWDNEARNPRPEYIEHIAGDLKARGYAVICICDMTPGREWLANGVMPPCNVALTHGELTVRQLLATVRDAAVVVGGVGWIVPAAIALGTPTFVVLGGNGLMNAPEKIVDPRMDARHIGFAMPEEYCRCQDMHHQCNKSIPDLDNQWQNWRRRWLARPFSMPLAAAD